MNERIDVVSVGLKANVYFDGRVVSRDVFFQDGLRRTIGVVLPGTYEFGVGDKEIVTIISGEAEVLLPPGLKEWEKVSEGSLFSIIKDSSYKLRCSVILEYLCEFIPE